MLWDCARPPASGMFRGRTGRMVSQLSFFLIKKEPFVLAEAVEFRPFVSPETLNARALIGLHLMAERKRLCVKW